MLKRAVVLSLVGLMVGGTVSASMPNMNATDTVYGYHLEDVYKDMEGMKNDYTNKLESISSSNDVYYSSVASRIDSIDSSISGISGSITSLENSTNTRIDSISSSVAEVQNNVESNQQRINHLESSTNQLHDSISSIHSNVSNLSNGVENARKDIQSNRADINHLMDNVRNINNDITNLKADTHKGLAQANALSSLKYLGGKGLQISVGTGGYRGTNAIAYGIFYGVTDDLMFYVGGTDNSYNGSINIRFK